MHLRGNRYSNMQFLNICFIMLCVFAPTFNCESASIDVWEGYPLPGTYTYVLGINGYQLEPSRGNIISYFHCKMSLL